MPHRRGLHLLDGPRGTSIIALAPEATSIDCARDSIAPVVLEAGDYSVTLVHDDSDGPALPFLFSFADGAGIPIPASSTPARALRRSAASTDTPSATLDVKAVKEYDPSVKHEFAYYDYADIVEQYPKIDPCTASDYSLASVKAAVDLSIASGEMSRAKPGDGFLDDDKGALYREYMLRCQPVLDRAESWPENVKVVHSIVGASWTTYASNAGKGEATQKYPSGGQATSFPEEASFAANT